MIGGTRAPPELAAASMPAACSRLNPAARISGIVKVPVVAVLATALPDREPIRPLLITATLAGAPRFERKSRIAKAMMKWVAPVFSSTAPNNTNRNTYVSITRRAMPNTPCECSTVWLTMRSQP